MTDRPAQENDPIRPDGADRVIFRDKRKIDPITGEARKAAPVAPDDAPSASADAQAASAGSAGSTAADALTAALAERTADLQRVQAEYANYRKRADRDRLAAGDVAISRVLAELLPVLDDIDRARSHDDLTGALKAVADHLEVIFTKLGLEAFGEVGDPFDPVIHEAVMHAESDEVTEPTSTTVMRRGYRHGDRLLRPAMVGVTEPARSRSGPETQTDEATPGAGGGTASDLEADADS
ncbi:MAG: nucleotide exchange factor GrpE [Actinomycetota bacterium]|nr:nucleotide exchange factor GrpE [Actinomycetota bacterium]